ncbi:gypsy/ty3 retroelement polyprotein [Tanacetum coccineum]
MAEIRNSVQVLYHEGDSGSSVANNNNNNNMSLGKGSGRNGGISDGKNEALKVFDEMSSIKFLEQDGSVREYYDAFVSFANKVGWNDLCSNFLLQLISVTILITITLPYLHHSQSFNKLLSIMVATRYTEITDPNNTVEAGFVRIQTAIDQINESIQGLLLFQQFTTNEINNLKAREGTSNRGGGGSDGITDDAQRIMLVSMHVFDKALNWHKQFIKRFGENVTWERYETKAKGRFDLVFDDPMVELKNLRSGQMVSATSTTTKSNRPFRKLTQKELEEKRTKQLCFYYDQKYAPGHKSSGQLYSLEVIGGNKELDKDKDMQLTKEGVMNAYTTSLIDEPLLISLNALSGENTYITMRVKGYVRKTMIHTLIDYGSTHNFLDWNTARNLGCRLRKICPLEVSVANGHVMNSLYECRGFSEELQGITYTADVMILPLGRCEMIEVENSYSKEVAIILEEFDSVFEMPKSSPPKRTHDHRIPLVPNIPPVNIRPYKHPPSQKDVVELTVKELLEQLNKSTVKDKFLILVVKELINELSGSKFFSKLDLRSRYHQIKMEENDVYKTTFRTHEGHYEFLVMPFGLTNAPSTFQSLVNLVFNEFLRKFVLVFFDDILIYSHSLESHLGHLRQVLTVMKSNSLFAKRSKCVFAATSVEYLGHIIFDKKFIKDYAVLKTTVMQAPVLALPDFDKTFTIETDASGMDIGAVLQQEGHLIAFLSKTLYRTIEGGGVNTVFLTSLKFIKL